ncbi:receptor-like serine/threonine-protein kinase At1g78530 [Rutidosis leptorrhynchoides]|uniref:receptor-like serine/threonine-protein kinase At1g78530 n=1 Tax=Rutidosis leptorrhynchoides TaxID=125765 RepID=UPI003A9A37CC
MGEMEKDLRVNLEHSVSQLSHLKTRLADITLATDNFSDEYSIFETMYYDIYRAEMELWDKENFDSIKEKNRSDERSERRTTVFIKRLRPREDEHGEKVFFTDIIMLATCKHHNIVTLHGFCDEGQEKILIVEDASNEYLVSYLDNKKDKSNLTWEKRLRICLDIAYGLKYLHYEMEDHKTVINRDISTFSITLDHNFRAKIADFGRSVFLPPNLDTLQFLYVRKTFPLYIDPEFNKSAKLRRESDVYSFGVVLFEILSGRLANDEMYMTDNKDGLAYVAHRSFLKGTITEKVDPIIMESGDKNFLTTKGPNKDSIDTFTKIAFWCLAKTQEPRPTVKVVVEELEKALTFQEQVKCQDSDQVVESIELKLTDDDPLKVCG